MDPNALAWCQKYVQNRCALNNWTTDWQNGMAFSAILNTFAPDKLSLDEVVVEDEEFWALNLESAFLTAEEELGIPKLLDGEDIVVEPDQKSIYTYVMECACLRHVPLSRRDLFA